MGADPVHVEHLDLGPVADALAERRQRVLLGQIGLDPGERAPLDLAIAGVLGLSPAALDHRLGHAAAEALAAGERKAAAPAQP